MPPSAYATCLTNLAEQSLVHRSIRTRQLEALSLGAWQHRPELTRRIHSILARTPRLNPAATAALILGLGGSLAFGSAELARCPQLIAFAPASNSTLATIATSPATLKSARLVRTAFEATSQPANNQFHPQMAVFRSTPPAKNRRKLTNSTPLPTPLARSTAPLAQQASSKFLPRFTSVRTSDHLTSPDLLNRAADQPENLSEPAALAQSEPNQPASTTDRYVVLTTVEQVSYPVPTDRPASVSSNTDQVEHDLEYRTTITRMIVHLIPATFKPIQPSEPARSGWFLFQL